MMTGMEGQNRGSTVQTDILPGRECGSCNVCCVALTIDEPAMQKLQGYRCKNTTADHRCTIYATRPDTCRAFNCGWRLLKWVRQPLRPDVSGVLVRLHREVTAANPAGRLGIVLTLLNRTALKADGLAETVAAAVSADVPFYLHLPGPPGYTSAQVRMNEALAHAVQTLDKQAVLGVLRQAYNQGKSRMNECIPIVLKKHAATDAPAP